MTIADGVHGTATVVSIGRPHSHAVRYLLPVRLSVQAPGMALFLHETSALIHRDRLPEPGVMVPVTVDRTDPRRVKIHWDRLPTIAEQAQAAHKAIVAGGGGHRLQFPLRSWAPVPPLTSSTPTPWPGSSGWSACTGPAW